MASPFTIACQKVVYAFRPQGELVKDIPETSGPQWECEAGLTEYDAKERLSEYIDAYRDAKSRPRRTVAFRMRTGKTTVISTTFSDLYAKFWGRK